MTTYQSTITPEAFAFLLARGQESEQISDGLRAVVRRYYEEYTDATDLDGTFLDAFVYIADESGVCGEDLIRDVEDEFVQYGRPVHTHTAACDHDNDEAQEAPA